MQRIRRWVLILLLFGALTTGIFFVVRFFMQNHVWFEAAGRITREEHNLMVIAVLLMLLVIIPVLALALGFAWWYRAGNTKAKYTPDWDHAKTDELIWWAIPFEIILVLGALTWTSTHELDPYKPLQSDVPAITVEVVSMNWKWLFIYPDEGIATVNQLEVPAGTPVNFKLTATGPMNAFWIPRLGSQIMTMTGMVTRLHLIADEEGTFRGLSSNFSGDGFSKMYFTVRSVSPDAYKLWVASVKNSGMSLDQAAYNELAKPSEDVSPAGYALAAPNLFEHIVSEYMPMDASTSEGMHMQ